MLRGLSDHIVTFHRVLVPVENETYRFRRYCFTNEHNFRSFCDVSPRWNPCISKCLNLAPRYAVCGAQTLDAGYERANMNENIRHLLGRRRFDVVEAAFIVLFAAIVVVASGHWLFALEEGGERAELARRFGPARYSEHEEEWAIRDFFHGQRNGVFVDVGANDYKKFSNTYFLEKTLGWSGLAIEPQREFAEGYQQNRPRTHFLPFFVAERSNETARLWVGSNRLVASADKDFTSARGSSVRGITVPTITLNDLLDHEGIRDFDFLSMDIELHEPQALAGFDLERFKPALVCVEAHQQVRQQILDYFAVRHYVVVGKYLRADTQNLYFAPLAYTRQSGTPASSHSN